MSRPDIHKLGGVSVDLGRRKRLGQFFTGTKLARLLAALASAQSARTIIDPMGGSGDMLAACLEIGAPIDTSVSVEIDPSAIATASERFSGNDSRKPILLEGDAFDPATINRLPQRSFDLVITNPPYVRYQSLSKQFNGDIRLPSSVEIRSNLIQLLEHLPHLDKQDRVLFQNLITSYSGLSDLAVPSWLLCALLTRVGGKLAMVVPESWLTRDYAQVVQYLLLRWFRIEFVVEDVHAVWFPEALVKTTLLVAERIERRTSAFDCKDDGYLHVRIDGQALGPSSVVERLYPGQENPEQTFVQRLERMRIEKRGATEPMFVAEWTSLRHQVETLKRSASATKWLRAIESSNTSMLEGASNDTGPVLPAALDSCFEGSAPPRFLTLEEIGVHVGQGLRTGANRFFYVDCIEKEGDETSVVPDPVFGISRLRVPSNVVAPVLRKQSEIRQGYVLDASVLNGRVLDLRAYALPEDLKYDRPPGTPAAYSSMPEDLAAFVRAAATTNVGSDAEPKWIPELSAVRTNTKQGDDNYPLAAPRFWYMLPPFAPRHRPDLFVGRVNSAHPKTVLNDVNRILVDANFSTFWTDHKSPFDIHALLALLNSSWCVACMELTGSVMGGGALKLEATHLRRLPIPGLNASQRSAMSKLGKLLAFHPASARNTIREVDALVLGSLFPTSKVEEMLSRLDAIKQSQLEARLRIKK